MPCAGLLTRATLFWEHLSYSLNSLNGAMQGTVYGSIIGLMKGDTRSVDHGAYRWLSKLWFLFGVP